MCVPEAYFTSGAGRARAGPGYLCHFCLLLFTRSDMTSSLPSCLTHGPTTGTSALPLGNNRCNYSNKSFHVIQVTWESLTKGSPFGLASLCAGSYLS